MKLLSVILLVDAVGFAIAALVLDSWLAEAISLTILALAVACWLIDGQGRAP